MPTTDLGDLTAAIKAIVTPPGFGGDDAAENLAKAIDDYIVSVVSKITGNTASNVSASPLFVPPNTVVPMDGGAALQTGLTAKAATNLTGTGVISQGDLKTN